MPRRLFSRRTPPPRQNEQRKRRLPVSIIIIAVLIGVFGLINPWRFPMDINPASVSLPAPTPRATAVPAPTDVHGGTIVFTCTRSDVNQICRIRADGSGYEQLTFGDSNSYYPAISPDSKHIVFAVNQYDNFDLYRLAPDLVEGARSAESRLKRLTDYVGNAFSPRYSPDGQTIGFINRRGDGPASLWMMRSDGQDPHPVYSPTSNIVGAAWSPDGRYIALTITSGKSFAYEVHLLDLTNLGAPPRRVPSELPDMGGSLSWAPDQSSLLVFAGPAAGREVFRLDIDTGEATQLTFGGNNASPTYSPDGRFIVFNSLRNGGQADLFVMLADGHSTRQLTTHPEPDWQPQWGP